MKKCGKCGEVNPFTEFYKANTKKCGYGSYCKQCQHEHYKMRYAYRTKVLKQDWQPFKIEYQDRNRIFIAEYLKEHPCVDCGEGDILVLDFDHVRGKKRASVSALVNRAASMESLREEIEKCEVRCANCHRRRRAEQFNWKSRRNLIFRRAKKGRRGAKPLALDFGPEYSCLVLAPLAQSVEQQPFKLCCREFESHRAHQGWYGAA
jgi:hypothetical protein